LPREALVQNACPSADTQIVLDVGANRPDLLSHLGVAREVAGVTGKPPSLPVLTEIGESALSAASRAARSADASSVNVSVGEDGLVRRFMGVVIRGVRVGPSPALLCHPRAD